MNDAEYSLNLEEFFYKLSEKYLTQIIIVGDWRFKRHRKQIFHKKGHIFQTCQVFNDQHPLILQIQDAGSWPNPNSFRLCLVPQALHNFKRDKIDQEKMSLWTFLTDNFASDKTDIGKQKYLTSTVIPLLGEHLNFSDEFAFRSVFNIGFAVEICIKNNDRTSYEWIYKTKSEKFIKLTQIFNCINDAQKYWKFKQKHYHKSFIDINETFFCSITKAFWCKNLGCSYMSVKHDHFNRHLESCFFDSNKTQKNLVSYKQIRGECYPAFAEARWLLNELGYQSQNSQFLAFDIETVSTKSKLNSNILAQNVISISFGTTWRQNDIQCLIRKNSSPKASLDLIKLFLDKLEVCQKEFEEQFCKEIPKILEKLQQFENPNPNFQKTIRQAEKVLKQELKLKE